MSIANLPDARPSNLTSSFTKATAKNLGDVLRAVQDFVSPVWPLRDYVAVNPYGGLADQKFLDARAYLQGLSSCETLMPLPYYQKRFLDGRFGRAEVHQAIDEMVADQIPGAESLNANAIFVMLENFSITQSPATNAKPRLQALSQQYDAANGTDWTATITDEISKFCSAHYDEGQAVWASPWQELSLYEAWRSAAQHDRRVELLGISGVRQLAAELPHTPESAVFVLLTELGVPQGLWERYLLCIALTIPGWSAWTKYKTVESGKQDIEVPDFPALLAMRLTYEVAMCRQFDCQVDLEPAQSAAAADLGRDEGLLGMTLLRANEIGFRKRVLEGIQARPNRRPSSKHSVGRRLAQMVFCIDVRSERIRRHLEATSSDIETFGFAGFFGLPFEYVRMGDESGTSQLPVLLDPQFKVYEDVPCGHDGTKHAKEHRSRIRCLRYLWKRFQTSAVSCFAFVETTGLLFAGKLMSRTFGNPSRSSQSDGVTACEHGKLGPSLRDLQTQGISSVAQVDMAEAMLRGIGLTSDFARLVVLCGHAATTENNPLQAGLDCGACAGHSGEPNARFGARLLNTSHVREGLADRGIEISDDVHFLAGVPRHDHG